jgi:hypothetical protein
MQEILLVGRRVNTSSLLRPMGTAVFLFIRLGLDGNKDLYAYSRLTQVLFPGFPRCV